jgi:hypothetical protein
LGRSLVTHREVYDEITCALQGVLVQYKQRMRTGSEFVIGQKDFGGRRAPYAPISALEKFLERMRDRSVPEYVDHRFLRRMSVASNNEYSLLSALKFLGILDDRGRPTHAYRQLQRADSFQDTLRHLVETAYQPVFDAGVERRALDDLVDFFRAESSPSQAKNAARFFLAVCRLAGIGARAGAPSSADRNEEESEPDRGDAESNASPTLDAPQAPTSLSDDVLAVKSALLAKLPAPGPKWSPELYRDVCAAFARMVESLDQR